MRDAASPLWSLALRPFYLLGAADMIVGVGWWAASLGGVVAPLDPWWHARETLYGGVCAVAAGFLLTAVPKWTGRAVVGTAGLRALVALWCAARAEHLLGFGPGLLTLVFLVTLTGLVSRAVVAGGVARQIVLAVLLATLSASWVAASGMIGAAAVPDGLWGGVSAFVLVITMIGGRVIPTFIDNVVPTGRPSRWPALDVAVVALTAVALFLLAPSIEGGAGPVAAGMAATAHLVRMIGWRPWRARRNLLLAVLPLGYLWVPLGFGLAASSAVPRIVALHAFAAGAMGMMMMALMTRSARGHTGRPLRASRLDAGCYAVIGLGAALRVVAGLVGDLRLLALSGILWALGFALFLVGWTRPLLSKRVDAPC